jgi:hypothetical protein
MLCTVFAMFRVYLHIIKFDFTKLPLSNKIFNNLGVEQLKKFHRFGLIFSLGFIVLHLPEIVKIISSYLLSK